MKFDFWSELPSILISLIDDEKQMEYEETLSLFIKSNSVMKNINFLGNSRTIKKGRACFYSKHAH